LRTGKKVMTLPTIISGEYAIFVFPKAVKTPSLVKKNPCSY
jgi:hypothetical protein